MAPLVLTWRPRFRAEPSDDQLTLGIDDVLLELNGEEVIACPVPIGWLERRRKRQFSEAMLAVSEFHRSFALPMASRPTPAILPELAQLRIDLLVEEVGEFIQASRESDLVALADALGDIVYVVYGAAVTYGIDLDAVVREVHRSNMSKLDEYGRPIYREDGKILKSHRYFKPNIAAVLWEQQTLPF